MSESHRVAVCLQCTHALHGMSQRVQVVSRRISFFFSSFSLVSLRGQLSTKHHAHAALEHAVVLITFDVAAALEFTGEACKATTDLGA
eukprot:scaffold3285_cov19-Tisochrysis_lutea.AAC.1